MNSIIYLDIAPAGLIMYPVIAVWIRVLKPGIMWHVANFSFYFFFLSTNMLENYKNGKNAKELLEKVFKKS